MRARSKKMTKKYVERRKLVAYMLEVLDVIVEKLCRKFLPLYPLFSKVTDGQENND